MMTGTDGIAAPTEQEFRLFQRMFVERLGIHLPPQKRALVSNRLWKRLQARNLTRFADYYQLINRPEERAELKQALELITTNETYFFREPRHFDFLRDELLPQISPQQLLRIWSAAASTGEEAYSIAMLLNDRRAGPWELLASDVNCSVLEKARHAIYLDERTGQIPPPYRRRYCRKGTGPHSGYMRIVPALRNQVRFQQVNLHEPLPDLGLFDVIFLRNVLIYFDDATKREVLTRIGRLTRPGGWLLVGHSESLHGMLGDFHAVAPSIYQKAGGGSGSR